MSDAEEAMFWLIVRSNWSVHEQMSLFDKARPMMQH